MGRVWGFHSKISATLILGLSCPRYGHSDRVFFSGSSLSGRLSRVQDFRHCNRAKLDHQCGATGWETVSKKFLGRSLTLAHPPLTRHEGIGSRNRQMGMLFASIWPGGPGIQVAPCWSGPLRHYGRPAVTLETL
jgi:hypothetical protein